MSMEAGSSLSLMQPHFYATLGLVTSADLPTTMEFTFKYANPRPISPHTLESYRNHLEDPLARCAWIIPIRGSLPWPFVTPASVLPDVAGDSEDTPSQELPLRTNSGSCEELIWTRDAMREFWKFLIELRTASRLGPLGLSFRAAPATAQLMSIQTDSGVNRDPVDVTPAAEEESRASTGKSSRSSLQAVDHFKIYCDANQAVRLRNVLDAWSFAYQDPNDVGRMKKFRLLRGVTLVLVDEESRGILTC